MVQGSASDSLLTLEPLLEAVRGGLEASGWVLSGLQKTTSYEFEGRWAGDSSRSAYLFFHKEGIPDSASIDVFLDETSGGLKGNLALVLDGPGLARARDPQGLLEGLAGVGRSHLPRGYRVPLTLRYRLEDLDADAGGAETEYRFKLHIPREAMAGGRAPVEELAAMAARAFEMILSSRDMDQYLEGASPGFP